ncbi:hypothetical protein I6F35_09015 [Bradyrhizobium sp. BRP22]|uniref:hypothetical protein n=1 Tax=Bradyrhizobium sp. BRP22 TaxID=2793821 RepID=UPI001CD4E529|nr:hypothetical protein [Bradyrhizobium sp. BRP22]MCA1453353.1 hypothetical protein [Bradyrhizobium sp. BRP22]
MRQPIDTAPRDGKDIWVESATGAFDIAHWSSETGEWVWKSGHPINIAPTHWYPITEDVFLEDEQSSGPLGRTGRRLTSLIAVILVAAAIVGVFDAFSERAASETTEGWRAAELNLKPEVATAWQGRIQRETAALMQDTDASRPVLLAGTVQRRQALEDEISHKDAAAGELAAATSADLRQSLHQERERSAALAAELAKVRGDLEAMLALSSKFQDDAVQRWEAAEIAAEELRQSLRQEQARATTLANELSGRRSETETRDVETRKADDAAAQPRQATEGEIAELRQSLEQERERTAALTREVGAARQAMTASAEQQSRALDEAKMRAAALASELAGARSEIESQTAQPKALDEAVQQKQAAEATIAELRQSLQQEREKTAALVREAETAHAAMASAEQQSRALEEAQARATALTNELSGTRREIEARDMQSRKANDEAARQRQAAEREIAELRQLLQRERSRTEAMARELASVRRPIDERVTVERAIEGPIVPATQTVAAAVTEPPTAADQDKAEAARLIARASALLGQGNIGAARIVLERAAENDNAQASFMLAETYDPAILSAWGTYGTRGEAAKARELYAKAHRGGIREAKDRLDALSR